MEWNQPPTPSEENKSVLPSLPVFLVGQGGIREGKQKHLQVELGSNPPPGYCTNISLYPTPASTAEKLKLNVNKTTPNAY